eukprot:679508-Rhodomonas_salina.1
MQGSRIGVGGKTSERGGWVERGGEGGLTPHRQGLATNVCPPPLLARRGDSGRGFPERAEDGRKPRQ